MERTPPHRRFERRFEVERPLETDPPSTALLRLTPRGRAALALLRARAAAEYRPQTDESVAVSDDDDRQGDS